MLPRQIINIFMLQIYVVKTPVTDSRNLFCNLLLQLLVMDEQNESYSTREKGIIRMRSIMDLGMGVLWLAMGVFLAFFSKNHEGLSSRLDEPVVKIFGFVCMLYGCFRIYRGVRKNYFKQ